MAAYSSSDESAATGRSEYLPRWARDDRLIGVALGLVLLLFYCLCAQAHINGSRSPYATDVGEIQNALPRWGTLHFTGYPQYSLLGSLFVTLLRPLGIAPALGASLFSAVWGALSGLLLYRLARELGAWRPGAALATIAAGLSLSVWMDASLAEVHTMTLALSIGSVWAAVRLRRTDARRDLIWLAILLANGVVHQRAVVFLAPALLIIVWNRLALLWRHALTILLIGLASAATYLYLPLRALMGADWTFNSPGTWQGFWSLVLDNKSTRIVSLPSSAAEIVDRLRNIGELLSRDLPWVLLILGLVGLLMLAWRRHRVEALALALIVVIHVAVSVIIWEGRISDALLAVKLPVIWTCALGLAFVEPRRATYWAAIAAYVVLLGVGAYQGENNIPRVLAVTHDRSSEAVVQRVAELAPPATPTTVWMPWGHDYWALTYAQRYRDELPGLSLVYHIASTADILDAGERLVTPEETFYVFAPDWWREQLGGLALSSVGDGLVQVEREPRLVETEPADAVQLSEDIAAADAWLSWADDHRTLRVSVTWYARRQPAQDYAVAVHLLGTPAGGEPPEVVAQADSQHPVYGWYPTTGWRSGELVADGYAVTVPSDVTPVELRLFMYTQDEAGFHNTEAVTLPVP